MSPLLFLCGLALSAPPAEAEAELLETARAAAARQDAKTVQQALRGWATLRKQRKLPTGLESQAAEAISWATDHGLLRVYGSRVAGRLRVGVDDPAGVVGRLDCFLQTPTGDRTRLMRAEVESAGRNEYVIPPAAAENEIVLEAILTEMGRADVVLRRTILGPAGAGVPDAPDPKQAAKKLGYEDAVPVVAVEPEPAIAWWWIAVGAVAAGLTGAAIWQETR